MNLKCLQSGDYIKIKKGTTNIIVQITKIEDGKIYVNQDIIPPENIISLFNKKINVGSYLLIVGTIDKKLEVTFVSSMNGYDPYLITKLNGARITIPIKELANLKDFIAKKEAEMPPILTVRSFGQATAINRLDIKNVEVIDSKTKKEQIPMKVVIVTFADDSIQKAVCHKNDTFVLEQGISICIAKQACALYGKNYNTLMAKSDKVYKSNLKAKEQQELEIKQDKLKKQKEYEKKKENIKKMKEKRIQELATAFKLALSESK